MPPKSWPIQSRRGIILSNGTFLVLVLFLLFYYTSWNVLTASPAIHTDIEIHTADEEIGYSAPSTAQSSPQSSYDSKKLAFLAETRPLPHLPSLFVHMAAIVPPEWTFKFMGSPIAVDFMRSNLIIRRLEASGKLSIDILPTNYSLSTRETISQMFTDVHLYREILAPAEHLLVFQPDSIFCASAPKTINDFLDLDWIGAPWSKTAKYGGNGGLSLRKVSKILKVLDHESRRHGDAQLEDLWLSDRLRRLPDAKMAIANISKTFSVESVWDESPLGYHVGWLGVHHEQIWDKEDQVKHILEYCPEVKMILGMKLDNDKPATIQKIESDAASAKAVGKELKESSRDKMVDKGTPETSKVEEPVDNIGGQDITKLVSHKITLLGDDEKESSP